MYRSHFCWWHKGKNKQQEDTYGRQRPMWLLRWCLRSLGPKVQPWGCKGLRPCNHVSPYPRHAGGEPIILTFPMPSLWMAQSAILYHRFHVSRRANHNHTGSFEL